MRRSSLISAAFVATLVAAGASEAHAQRAVISHDEWMTQSGYFGANEQLFVANTLNWFGLGGTGNILLYSGNSFLTNAPFQSYLSALGYSVTVSTSPASLAGYDAVFSEGVTDLDGAGLANYVSGGGNVFYFGGTGIGGAAGEAAYSNPFLNAMGLQFASVYNGIGTVNTSGFAAEGPYGAALFTGVSSVYANNGNSLDITVVGAEGWNNQVFRTANGSGVFAAAEFVGVAVPEPATGLLMLTGLLGLSLAACRRREART